MADPRAVLLIPADGDPHGLLRGGPCGAQPPIVGHDDEHPDWRHPPPNLWKMGEDLELMPVYVEPPGWERALVLVWDGQIVRSGVHIARDALSDGMGMEWPEPHALTSVERLVEACVRKLGGRVKVIHG